LVGIIAGHGYDVVGTMKTTGSLFDNFHGKRILPTIGVVVEQMSDGFTINVADSFGFQFVKDLFMIRQRTIVRQDHMTNLDGMIVFVVVAIAHGGLTTMAQEYLGQLGILSPELQESGKVFLCFSEPGNKIWRWNPHLETGVVSIGPQQRDARSIFSTFYRSLK